MNADFRFYGPLNDFFPPERRGRAFAVGFLLPASVKDMMEAAGVPHPEVDLILANGAAVDFSYLVRHQDRIAVYPAFFHLDISSLSRLRKSLRRPAFVLDTHLGVLAGYLRMLGFDTMYRNDCGDHELAHISSEQDRILLTRDRGLLRRSEVVHGYFVRETAPRCQIQEVLQRFALRPLARPFERCIRCNGLLHSVEKQAVRHLLPERTASSFDQFTRCGSCGRIYWQGSHFDRMRRFIEGLRVA